VTPHYLELTPYQVDGAGYHMGVYLCLGQAIHEAQSRPTECVVCSGRFTSHAQIHEYMSIHRKIFLFLAEGKHKIKKKAEQIACELAIQMLKSF
jgi:hypothetical protein